MKTPDESLLAVALEAFGAANSPQDIASGSSVLIDGMGLERYAILDIRGGGGAVINGLYHNAPAALAVEAAQLGSLIDDHLVKQTRISRIPFTWAADPKLDPWRYRHASAGYRSGVAAMAQDGSGAGTAVILSWAGDQVSELHAATVLGYTLLAAVTLMGSFKRFVLAPASASPLSERELDCLLYALAGKSSKETARALGIDTRTVHQYLERARAKLQAVSSYAAAMTALRNGWLDMQQAMELSGLAPSGTRKV